MSSSTYGWSSSQHPRAQEPEDNSSIEQHPEQDQYQPQHPLLSGYQQPYPLYHMPSTYSAYTHPPPSSVPVWSHHHPSMTGVIVHPPPQYPLARRSPDRDEDSIRSHHYGSASGTPLPTPVSATSFRSMTSSTSTSASASTRDSELRPNDGSRPIMLARSRRAAAAKANSNISSVTAILRAPSLPIVQSVDEESPPKTGASSSILVLREKDEVSSDEESLPEANETDDEEYGVTARPKRDLVGAATRPKRAGYTARAVRARNPVNRQAPVKAKPGRSRARGKASRAKKEQQVDDTLPFALQNCRGPLLDVPPGAEVEVNGLLILTPPAVQAPPSAFQPFNQYSQAPAPEGYQSPFEMYTCRACAKTYDGKNARSVARRHLQDKHGVPLALQARRTRWDGAPAEVPHVVAAEAREKNLLSKRLWANKNRSIQRIEREYATFLAPYGPNGVVTPCGVRLVAPEMRKVQPEDGEYSDGERLSWLVLPPNMKSYMDMVRQGQTLPLLLLRRPLGENETKMVPLVPGPIKTGAKAKTSKKRGGQKQPIVDPGLQDADSGAEEDLDYSFNEDQAAGPSTSQSNSLYPLQSTWPQGDLHTAPAPHLSEQELQAGLAHHSASAPYAYGSVQYGHTYPQPAFTAPHHFHPRQDGYNQDQLGDDDAYDVEGEEELDDQSEHSPVLQQLQPTAVVHQQWVQTVMPPIYTNGVWYQPFSGPQSYSYPQGPIASQQNQIEVAHIEEVPNLDVKGMDDSLAETHLQEEDVHGVVENEKSDSDIEVENIAAESLLDLHSTPMQPETDSSRPAVNTSILSSSSLATLQRTGSDPSSDPSTVTKSSHLHPEVDSSRSGLMEAPEIMSRPRPVRSRSVVQPFVKSRPDAYSRSISFNEHVELDDPFMTGSPVPSNKKRRNTVASPSPLQQKKKRDTISDRMPLSVLQANSALGGSLLGNIPNVSPMKLDKSSLDRPGMDYTTPMRPSHGLSASASRPSLWMLSSPANGDAAASLGLAPGWGGLLSTPGVSGIVASDTPGRGGGSMSKLWDRRGSVVGMGKKET